MPSGAGPGRRLLVVRHGRTAWNAEGRAQGHADVGLDDVGRRQAEAMAARVADLRPSLLVTSDLARARETAALLEKATGLTAVEDARWREFDLGERTGLTRAEFGARRGDLEGVWDPHAHVVVPGVETVADVADRMGPAFADVLAATGAGETAVVVTHGAALRVGLAVALGWPVAAAEGLATMRNCAWATLEEAPGGRLRLASYDTSAVGGPPDWPSATGVG